MRNERNRKENTIERNDATEKKKMEEERSEK